MTAGGKGWHATKEGEEFSVEAVKAKLVSTRGAGDEFTGVLAAELACGKDIRSALVSANRATSVLVSTPHGT
nr:PfkB family carbohydrate kinase [Ciceribacter ferrooxidans]